MSLTVMLESESDSDSKSDDYTDAATEQPLGPRYDWNRGGCLPAVQTSDSGKRTQRNFTRFYGSIQQTRKQGILRNYQAPACELHPRPIRTGKHGRRLKIFCIAIFALAVVFSVVTFAYCVPSMVTLRRDFFGNQSGVISERIQKLSETVKDLQMESKQMKAVVDENTGEINEHGQAIARNMQDIAMLKSSVREIERRLSGASKVQINIALMMMCIAAGVFL